MQEFETKNQPNQDPEILVSQKEANSVPVTPKAEPAEYAAQTPAARPTPARPATSAPSRARRMPSGTAQQKPKTPVQAPAAPAPEKQEAKPSVKDAVQALFSDKKERKVEEEPKKEKASKKESKTDRGGIVVSVLKALVYIAFVLVVSGFLAVYGIRVANDIFAFVKDEVTVEVTVEEGDTLADIADMLYNEGLVENADWFRIYTEFKYRKSTLEFVPGTYTLNSTMNYKEYITMLTPRGGRTIVSVLIPEGFTVDQIIDLLVEKGIGTREGYIDAIQNYDYNYEFLDVLDSIEKKEGRKYRLEGYLFPAKYDVYQDSSEIAVVDKMLAAFQANFTEVYNDRLTELNMNMDEVIILASIIQREAHFSSDMYYISGVFHNRLNNSANFPFLGSDATVQYALPEHKEELTKEDLAVDSPYNTHLYKGLTPGAICNPGLEAITAALYPEDKLMESRGVKSYYFVAGYDGYSIFGATASEHAANIAKVAADKEAAKAKSNA